MFSVNYVGCTSILYYHCVVIVFLYHYMAYTITSLFRDWYDKSNVWYLYPKSSSLYTQSLTIRLVIYITVNTMSINMTSLCFLEVRLVSCHHTVIWCITSRSYKYHVQSHAVIWCIRSRSYKYHVQSHTVIWCILSGSYKYHVQSHTVIWCIRSRSYKYHVQSHAVIWCIRSRTYKYHVQSHTVIWCILSGSYKYHVQVIWCIRSRSYKYHVQSLNNLLMAATDRNLRWLFVVNLSLCDYVTRVRK